MLPSVSVCSCSTPNRSSSSSKVNDSLRVQELTLDLARAQSARHSRRDSTDLCNRLRKTVQGWGPGRSDFTRDPLAVKSTGLALSSLRMRPVADRSGPLGFTSGHEGGVSSWRLRFGELRRRRAVRCPARGPRRRAATGGSGGGPRPDGRGSGRPGHRAHRDGPRRPRRP